MPMPKSLKRFFAVLEPGTNASKYQPESPESSSSQQQQQHHHHHQQQNVFSQDKKSSMGKTTPPSTKTTTNQPPAKQPDASYLAYQPAKLSTTQAFWQSQNITGGMS